MTTLYNSIIRAGAFLVLVLALWSVPSGVRAQEVRCICDHYTVVVDRAVECKVIICWAFSPFERPICETVAPGGRLQIPCPVYEAYIQLCDGTLYPLISTLAAHPCTEGLVVAPGCCVRACRGIDREGCPLIVIEPWHCVGADC